MSDARLNAPNVVAGLRLVLAPGLLVTGAQGRETAFLLLFLALELADLLDGMLARMLHQQTVFGARLDSVADLVMYACLVAGLVWLAGEPFTAAWPWIAVAAASYVAAIGVSLARFRRLPSYHTWTAKASSVLVVGAVVLLVLADDPFLVRITAATVTVANVEGLLLSWRLDRPRSDLASALLLLRGEGGRYGGGSRRRGDGEGGSSRRGRGDGGDAAP